MKQVLATALVLMVALSAVATVELPDNGQVVVDRLMDSEWHQRRPFNDFMPVDWADMPASGAAVKNESKRGRMTCGCVADAMGQILRYFKWPVRLDKTVSFEHNWKNERIPAKPWSEEPYESPVTGKMKFCVEGHVPFEYASMTNVWEAVFKDARGTFPEIDRYPAARLIRTVGVLLQMDYRTTDSGSYPYTMTEQMTDWYETPVFKRCNGSFANGKADILACLQSGIPVTASLPGHQIVIHGYAKVGEDDYVFVAWDNQSEDGWVDASTLAINEACIGFKPKKMVQLEPLRAVEDASVTVRWTLPEIWTSDVTGFTAVATPAGGVAVTMYVGAADRACTFSGLTPGQTYSFRVTPTITGAVVSPAVTTTIATAAKPALAWPTIEVWGPTTNVFGETWYHENATDKGFVYVRCPSSVTDLSVVSGNLTALPQDKITVRSYGAGNYAVVFDGSNVTNVPSSAGISSMNRQRMIATLVATDANGTSVYKNLSLRFSSDTPIAEPAGLTPSDPDPGSDPDPTPVETTNTVPLSVNLGFVMTADNVMKVTYDVATNGVSRTWEDGTFTFMESGAGRNLWRGDGNQNIGANIRVKKFLSGTWAGFPVPNTNLEQPDGIVAGKYWEIDVPFDLRVALAVTNVFPKAFITTSAGADTDGGQPVSNNKQLDVTVAVLSPDKATTQAVTTVRTGVLGATRVNEVVGALTTTLSNGVLRIRVAHGAGACTGAFGGIQGVSFTGAITVVGGESGGDGGGGQGDGGDEPVLPVVVGTNVVVAPLCTAMWNQGRHYNRMAPVTDVSTCPDGRMWAGCTAVATAILMKHYEWPPQGETWYQSLNDEKSWANDNTAIALRARFDEPYAWDRMQDVYGNVTGSEASMAVAQLMSDIGAVMNMNYGSEGSSTLRENVAGVLEHNFRFDASQLYQVNNSFTPEVEARIQAQLRDGHPIVSAGAAGLSGTGHTYVCDGYELVVTSDGATNALYHFNFGWGGTSNGWYPLNAVFTAAKPGEAAVERPVESMLLGVYPQKEPLIRESSEVSGPQVELVWSIARCWTNGLERFVVEDQVKGEPVERADALSGDDWFIYVSYGSSYGWTKENGKVVGKVDVFHSVYGDSYYWPGQGGGFFSDRPVTVSAETDVEIRYAARYLPPGVKLEVVRCKWDEGMQTYIDHDGNYNFYEPFATLEGGTSQSELTERTVTIPGSVVAKAFDGGDDDAHFCIRIPYGECAVASYGENTVVFRLDSFSVKGRAESWETARSVELASSVRSHVFEDAAVTNHRFVVYAQYADKTVSSSVKKTVRAVAPVQPSVTLVSAVGRTLTYEVSNTTDYSYEFVTQSNALRGNHQKDGGTVTYTLANAVADVGTHWVTIYVTDNKSGMKAKYVHYTNPSPSHPLCDLVEPSVEAAAARAKREGKLILLMQSGDPDAAKFMALSGILASNEVVDVISKKYVLTEVIASVPDQRSVGRSYWRSQPQFGLGPSSYQPEITAYASVINPENADEPYPCADLPSSYMNANARWLYFNSQYDLPNLGSSYYVSSATVDLVRFLNQSEFVVTAPIEDDDLEPSVEGGDAAAAIVRNADGEYVVTPAGDGGGQYVMINNVGTHVIAVPPSVACVIGVPASQLKVKVGVVDITTAFARCGDAGGLYLELNADGVVTNGNEILTVRPALTSSDDTIKPLTVGTAASVGVKTIPGLKYTLWRGTALDGLMTSVSDLSAHKADETVAEGTRTSLTDPNPPVNQAFYVIQVGQP